MPLLNTFTEAELNIGVWKISESLDELKAMASETGLPVSGMEAFKSMQRGLEWLASRLLVCRMFGEVREVLSRNDGKPYINGMRGCISISHTKGYAALLISDNVGAGVDIERRERDALSLIRMFVNADELHLLECENPSLMALLIWSAKEALFKIVGNLGGNFKDNITVGAFVLSEKGCFSLTLHGIEGREIERFLCRYRIEDEYLLTVCVPDDNL